MTHSAAESADGDLVPGVGNNGEGPKVFTISPRPADDGQQSESPADTSDDLSERDQRFAPRHIFHEILAYTVIPTFDLILEFEDGIFLGKRRIAPYRGKWALPGLRLLKGESIDEAVERIAQQEAGVLVDGGKRRFIGQASPMFSSENARQDLATCYVVPVPGGQRPTPNAEHFSAFKLVATYADLPSNLGVLYYNFLRPYFECR